MTLLVPIVIEHAGIAHVAGERPEDDKVAIVGHIPERFTAGRRAAFLAMFGERLAARVRRENASAGVRV